MSQSKIAIKPANNKVNKDKIKSKLENFKKTSQKRIMRKTPAVTKVDECTKEETGVGAAIAAGNQEEKGTWALFVIKAIITKKNKKKKPILASKISRSQKILKKTIENKKKTSPNRFTRKVSIPALDLETLR